MRRAWVGMLVLSSGCATTPTSRTVTSERIAFATHQSAPLAMAGAPGVSLTARILTGEPQQRSSASAVAFSTVQPEVGGLLQLGERTWVGGRFNLASASFGALHPAGSALPTGQETALDVAVSAGHDLPINERFGVTFSGELGLTSTDVTSRSSLGITHAPTALTLAAGGLGAYANVGPVRLYLAGVASTSVWSAAVSTVTENCGRFGSCSVTDTGVVGNGYVVLAGAGARYQVNPGLSLGLELWVPLASDSVLPAPSLGLSLRVGDFVVARKKPPTPPTEPPLISSQPEETPVPPPQL